MKMVYKHAQSVTDTLIWHFQKIKKIRQISVGGL